MTEKFVRKLTVDKRIVPLLSKSTYQRSFPYAIREIISNAYDADATTVKINVNLDKKEILISDNGNGMSLDEFGHYLRIAGQKRERKKTPKFGRKRIGRFGIGFLSIFPFCKVLEITSTTEYSKEIFTAQIPAWKFFEDAEFNENIDDIDVEGFITKKIKKDNDHFTEIKLKNLTELAWGYFDDNILNHSKESIKSLNGIQKFIWQLQEDLPLRFKNGSALNDILKYPEPIDMQIYVNQTELFRNELEDGSVIETGLVDENDMQFKFAIITNWKAIKPYELRGLKIRMNNVGIGARTDFDIQKTRAYSRMQWITGEIQIIKGFDDGLTISRDDFIITPTYEKFISICEKLLRKMADYVEDIDVAIKDMEKNVKGSKQSDVISIQESVEKNLKLLKEKGFEVKFQKLRNKLTDRPLTIDRNEKKIIVVDNHPAFSDSIIVAGKIHNITYSTWKLQPHGNENACRLTKEGFIEINKDYPLFKSKRYGDIFKKIFIVILLSKHENRNTKNMYEYIMQNLNREFENY